MSRALKGRRRQVGRLGFAALDRPGEHGAQKFREIPSCGDFRGHSRGRPRRNVAFMTTLNDTLQSPEGRWPRALLRLCSVWFQEGAAVILRCVHPHRMSTEIPTTGKFSETLVLHARQGGGGGRSRGARPCRRRAWRRARDITPDHDGLWPAGNRPTWAAIVSGKEGSPTAGIGPAARGSRHCRWALLRTPPRPERRRCEPPEPRLFPAPWRASATTPSAAATPPTTIMAAPLTQSGGTAGAAAIWWKGEVFEHPSVGLEDPADQLNKERPGEKRIDGDGRQWGATPTPGPPVRGSGGPGDRAFTAASSREIPETPVCCPAARARTQRPATSAVATMLPTAMATRHKATGHGDAGRTRRVIESVQAPPLWAAVTCPFPGPQPPRG